MEYRIDIQPGEVCVHLSGTLSFTDHAEFRRMVSEVMAAKPRKVAVDLGDLTTIDSAGLGLLVILSGEMKQGGGTCTLRRPNEAVTRLLSIVHFEKLCAIEP